MCWILGGELFFFMKFRRAISAFAIRRRQEAMAGRAQARQNDFPRSQSRPCSWGLVSSLVGSCVYFRGVL